MIRQIEQLSPLSLTRPARSILRSATPARRRPGSSSYVAAGLTAGAALGGIALWVRNAARRAERRHPASGTFIEAEGVHLHYLERGAGEPVVLLHGNGTQAQDFVGCGLVEGLAAHYRVIAFDRPGFGYSQRPRLHTWSPTAQAQLLRAAFDQLGIQRPVVVGHSWGTMVALALALNYPEAVRGLLLVSGYYYPSVRWDALMEFPPAIPVIGDLMRYTLSPLLGRLLVPRQVEQLFAPEPVPDAFYQAVPLEMMLRPSPLRAGAAEAGLMVPAAQKLSQRYHELRLPITLVAGTEDRIVNHRAHTLRLHQELPHSRFLPLPGLGHMPHYAAPELLAQAVDDFFAVEASPSGREKQRTEAS